MKEESSNVILRALGSRIRELRTERGYSQEGFADQCGVHRTFMGTVERGESNLSFSNIAKVADTLGVTLSVLFLNIEDKARSVAVDTSKTGPVPSTTSRKPGPKKPAH